MKVSRKTKDTHGYSSNARQRKALCRNRYEHGNMSGHQTGTNKKIRSYRVFVSLFLLLDSSVIIAISEIPTSAPKS